MAVFGNWKYRNDQYKIWQQHYQIFHLDDGTPLFTNPDSPYFLAKARVIMEHGNIGQLFYKRIYPLNLLITDEKLSNNRMLDFPLLSVILSIISKDASTKSLSEAGHSLIPIAAGITAIMIVIAFGIMGYWAEGSVAALGGGLSIAYLHKSGAGHIDTDMLNLGFFYLMCGLVVLTAKTKPLRTSIIWAGLAGVTMRMFIWWYDRPLFGIIFCSGLILLSLILNRDVKRVILQALVFIFLSGILWRDVGIGEAYFAENFSFANIVFPNVFETITELRILPFATILSLISGSVFLGVISLIGFFLWAFLNPKMAIILVPVLGFMLLNFVFGSRTIFYSAPALWFGLAYLVSFLFSQVFGCSKRRLLRDLSMPLSTIINFLIVWYMLAPVSSSQPFFSKEEVREFTKIKDLEKRPNSVVMAWWDYGYLSILVNDLATIHDGGGQTSINTYYFAKSLLSTSQKESAGILKSLVNGDIGKSLKGGATAESMQAEFQDASKRKLPIDAYLVLTGSMNGYFNSIAQIGLWDEFKGKPIMVDHKTHSSQLSYSKSSCTQYKKNIVKCGEAIFDLNKGSLNGKVIVRRIVRTKDGSVIDNINLNRSDLNYVLQVEDREKNIVELTIMHKRLYDSTYHQLLNLGLVDNRYFSLEEGYGNKVKVYKLRN